jgi:Uma2 family endonuclease
MATAPRLRTLDEFLALPEEEPALEFANGVVTQKVSPQGKHSALQSEIARLVNNFALPRRLARAFTELRTTYAGASYVPDVAVYAWARVPVDALGRVANAFREPPDLAVEIVSPEQGVNAPIRRCLWSVAHGVSIALLVDPSDESMVLFRPGQVPLPLSEADRLPLGALVPGLELTVADVFATLRVD